VILAYRWANLPAPEMAKGYYRLPENAKWIESLKCMVSVYRIVVYYNMCT
jgi:hypothetical protein